MGKKKAPAESQDSAVSSAVISQRFGTWSLTDKLLRLGIVVAVAFVAICLTIFLVRNFHKAPLVSLKTGQAISGQVAAMQHDDLVKLSTARVSHGKNLDRAYAKALALVALNKPSDAAKEYEAIIKTGRAPYYMYEDYGIALALNHDYKKAIDIMQQAVTKLKADSSVSADVKASTTKSLNSKIDGFKDQAGIK